MSLATRGLAQCSLPDCRGGLRSLFSFSSPQVSMSSASSGSRKREARPGPSSRFVSPPAVGAEGYFSPSAPHLGLCWGFLRMAVYISIILDASDIERVDKAR